MYVQQEAFVKQQTAVSFQNKIKFDTMVRLVGFTIEIKERLCNHILCWLGQNHNTETLQFQVLKFSALLSAHVNSKPSLHHSPTFLQFSK